VSTSHHKPRRHGYSCLSSLVVGIPEHVIYHATLLGPERGGEAELIILLGKRLAPVVVETDLVAPLFVAEDAQSFAECLRAEWDPWG
jgi:hypothetical protein